MSYYYGDPEAAEMANIVADRLKLYIFDKKHFLQIAERGLKFFPRDQNHELRLSFLGSGWLSLTVFHALISGGESYSSGPVRFLWDCLEREQVIVNSAGDITPNNVLTHQINGLRLLQLIAADALPNIFRPPSALARRYVGAILAVDVKKAGTNYRGSGFLFRTPAGTFVVTCKHNVDPDDGVEDVRFTNVHEQSIETGKPLFHRTLDLACFPVTPSITLPVFASGSTAEMFDEVFTLGYPKVPGGTSALVGHRGEVNGHIDLYLAKSPAILISNLVSPGSSGCPVLRSDGLCIGMTIRWAEGDFADGTARFSCALPISEVTAFLKSV